ncbi:hypothetical protein BDP27DRAFT_1376691 [Rhodocollybia butyracea]|uniref:Uncharacterized protein n=1 Tax=Rhodocollybia butyracea TaxID=206335 RepID=A0A9P5TWN6_9AGAR|nr:hypothetical protein BDP27DRAFT_1376691 [Rhodocollybia butyracea]
MQAIDDLLTATIDDEMLQGMEHWTGAEDSLLGRRRKLRRTYIVKEFVKALEDGNEENAITLTGPTIYTVHKDIDKENSSVSKSKCIVKKCKTNGESDNTVENGGTDNAGSGAVIMPNDRNIKLGAQYDPHVLSNYGGLLFCQRLAKLKQADFRNVKGDLIPPWRYYNELRPGTLIIANISIAVYVIPGKEGRMDRKIYHANINSLKVLAYSDIPIAKPGVDEPRNDAGSLAFKALLDDTKGSSSDETLGGEAGKAITCAKLNVFKVQIPGISLKDLVDSDGNVNIDIGVPTSIVNNEEMELEDKTAPNPLPLFSSTDLNQCAGKDTVGVQQAVVDTATDPLPSFPGLSRSSTKKACKRAHEKELHIKNARKHEEDSDEWPRAVLHAMNSSAVTIADFNASTLPVALTGWLWHHLSLLIEKKFKLVNWDGKTCTCLVDEEDHIVAVLAGQPIHADD